MQITLSSQNQGQHSKPKSIQMSDLLLDTISLIEDLQHKNLLFPMDGNRFTSDLLLKSAVEGGTVEFLLCSSEIAKLIKQCSAVRRLLGRGILNDQEASQYVMARTDSFKSWLAHLESFTPETLTSENRAARFIDDLNCISSWQHAFIDEAMREGFEVDSWRHLLHVNTVHDWLGSHFALSSISEAISQIDEIAFLIRRLSQQIPGTVESTTITQDEQNLWHYVRLHVPCEMVSDAIEKINSDYIRWTGDEISSGEFAIRVKRTFDVLNKTGLNGLGGMSEPITEFWITVFGKNVNNHFCSELDASIASRIADELDAIKRIALVIRH